MLQKILVCLALFCFLVSSSPFVDSPSRSQSAHSQASLSVPRGDFLPAASLAFALKRLARAKSVVGGWISGHTVAPYAAFSWATIDRSLSLRLFKYDVYQRMNVYRL
jgi:hypothetical protein